MLGMVPRDRVLGATGQGQSHEISRDSAGMFDRALQYFAISLSSVSGFDYRSDAVAARQHQ
jgi:hypothetical protein